MTNEKQVNGEKLAKFVKETPEEVLKKLMVEAIHENMYELCMKTLKEKDRYLKLTGNYKKCYSYLAEQVILNYIDGKSMLTIIDDIKSGKFYNTWKGFLCGVTYVVEHVVEYDGKFHSSLGRGIEDIINSSGISRKVWIRFLDYYFQ